LRKWAMALPLAKSCLGLKIYCSIPTGRGPAAARRS